MKEVSLYEEIFSRVDGEVEKLGKDAGEEKLNSTSLKYETKVPQLEKMCYIMEQVLLKKKTEAVVYAGFQKVSRARDIWDRFLTIADNVDKVYIFGEKDDELKEHPNIEFIYLPQNHKLKREWFLVIDQPLAKSMMVAYDLDGFGTHEIEKERNFKGAKCNNPDVVKQAKELLDDVIASCK
ncbi:DICT sensory domain-containing protein [Natranaerofaba carboxydovora]|uniref:DICT sensory domain-containing protein n=1 Tax=Natranaerofaba carboxydovora TaxID=2742683 RepID=UPI001F13453D|nr:DICT sensory domain-containing protein [Natranaerofaba carboxydovora]UMZ73681.1 Sensory domain in DIguanylate Cyclases and Two-component system [Natranaerofaba carboxydovora]